VVGVAQITAVRLVTMRTAVVGVVELEVVELESGVVSPPTLPGPSWRGMSRGGRNTASLKTSPSGVVDLWSPIREPVILLPGLGEAKQTG